MTGTGHFIPKLRLASAIMWLAVTAWGANVEYEVVHGWPKLPEGMILGQAAGVAVDSHDNVFVFRRADHLWLGGAEPPSKPIKTAAVLLFDGRNGALLQSWGGETFVMPHGLTVDSEDNVWLTDVGLHQVLKFTHGGRMLMALGERGVPGADTQHFNKPTDVAVRPDASFYVSDGYGNSRVLKFSREGKILMQWGERGDRAGQFRTPHGLELDSDGRLYVADRGNARVQVFDETGKWLSSWRGTGLGRPWALARSGDGGFFVVDGGDQPGNPIATVADRARILKVDASGAVLGSFGAFGNYDGQFVWPHDIAVARDGSVYVVDVAVGMRVQKFVPRR